MTRVEEMVLNHLSQFVSDHKKSGIDKVLLQRTGYVTVVLENIFQSQNASAAVRTCECMGLQDVHIIEDTTQYHLNFRVLKGSNKWINMERYHAPEINNTERCFHQLRSKGYKILVADPAEDGISIDDIDVSDGKLALVFGNELNGVSAYGIQHADKKIKIPMFGFTESLNISVSVAICLNTVLTKLRRSRTDIGLSAEEKNATKLTWYRKIVKRADVLEREFLRTIE